MIWQGNMIMINRDYFSLLTGRLCTIIHAEFVEKLNTRLLTVWGMVMKHIWHKTSLYKFKMRLMTINKGDCLDCHGLMMAVHRHRSENHVFKNTSDLRGFTG